jgi:tripartite-type tricarboxylate transporter receptor subunit TctC
MPIASSFPAWAAGIITSVGQAMNTDRRAFLQLASGAAFAPLLPRGACALDYPTRPVRTIVGFAPGGPGDTVMRVTNQWLSERLGQQFFIENRPGAGTNVATQVVISAAPDGYTLLLATTANAINAPLCEHLDFKFLRDIAPVARIDRVPLVMEVNPAVLANTVPEFIAYAKANAGKINMASGGIGTIQHVAGELFKFIAGVDLTHVPYRGAAPAITDLLSGRVQVTFVPIQTSIGHIRAGKLRALAVTGATRSPTLPDVPTVGEFLKGYEAVAWDGIGAPKDTPAEILDKLNATVNAALADPEVMQRVQDYGGVPAPLSRADFEKFIAAETDKWAKLIKLANIKPE